MHHPIVPIELKLYLFHIKKNPLYHFQGGTTIRHTHGSTTGCRIFSSADSSKCSDLNYAVQEMLR